VRIEIITCSGRKLWPGIQVNIVIIEEKGVIQTRERENVTRLGKQGEKVFAQRYIALLNYRSGADWYSASNSTGRRARQAFRLNPRSSPRPSSIRYSTLTRSALLRPKVSGEYISSALAGGVTKLPGVVARATYLYSQTPGYKKPEKASARLSRRF
jgi:hypothetical protein